jgi:hypothetical protein
LLGCSPRAGGKPNGNGLARVWARGTAARAKAAAARELATYEARREA